MRRGRQFCLGALALALCLTGMQGRAAEYEETGAEELDFTAEAVETGTESLSLTAETVETGTEKLDFTAEAVETRAEELDFTVDGTDSVGEMLAGEIARQQAENEVRDSQENSVTGLVIEGGTAFVELSTGVSAEVAVAIYDEDMLRMYGSGKTLAEPGDTSVTVELELSESLEEMPDSFMAAAYLLDEESHQPLCGAYSTSRYVKAIQDLMDSTAEDYREELVLNLDGDTNTNFAVYRKDTVQAEAGAAVNQVTDHGDGSYTIAHANEQFTGLAVGDTFSYEYGDGTVLLVKAASVFVDGTTVYVQEDPNADLTDFFDYVKIEAESDGAGMTLDEGTLGEGVTYEGLSWEEAAAESGSEAEALAEETALWSNIPGEETDVSPLAAEEYGQADEARELLASSGEVSFGPAFSFHLDKKLNDHTTLKGSLKSALSLKFSYYLSFSYQEVSLVIDYGLTVNVEVSGKAEGWEIPLGSIQTQLLPGVSAGFTPFFVGEASGELSWSGKIGWKIGFSYDSNNGFQNASKAPDTSSEVKLEGKLFVGIKATPYVAILSEKLCKATMETSAGLEASSEKQPYSSEKKDYRHSCEICLGGELNAKLEVSASVDLLKDKVDLSADLVKLSYKIRDFYWSVDYQEFGWTTCPRISWLTTLTAVDEEGTAIPGAAITVYGDDGEAASQITDEEGNAEVYLPDGTYDAVAQKDEPDKGYGMKRFVVEKGAQKLRVEMQSRLLAYGTCGENLTWTLDKEGLLQIRGTGEMDSPGKEQVPWYAYRDSICSVEIAEGVTTIGGYAFTDCKNLTSVVIPEGVTTIYGYAFADCKNLTNVVIPDSVTKLALFVFQNCSSLEQIKLPENGELSSIPSYTFYGCTSLESIHIPEGVKRVDSCAFEGCTSLERAELPDSLSGLLSLDYNAFKDCSSLTEISIPGGVPCIENRAFYGCTSLKRVEFSEGLEEIGMTAFMKCTSLKEVVFPKTLKYIDVCAFQGCESLADIVFSSPVNISNGAFIKCTSLKRVELPEGLAGMGKGIFEDCTGLEEVVFPESFTTLNSFTFMGCTGLKTLYFKGSKPTFESGFGSSSGVTAYYPQDDDTWADIEETYEGGGRVIWVPYDPSSLFLSSISDGETDGGQSSAAVGETEGAVSDQVVEIELDLWSGEDAAQAENGESGSVSENDKQAGSEENGNMEENLAEGTGEPGTGVSPDEAVIVEESAKLAYSGASGGEDVSTAVFRELDPGSQCVFAVVKDSAAADLLAPANLLYIAQRNVGADGSVRFRYILPCADSQAETVIFGTSAQEPPAESVPETDRDEGEDSRQNQEEAAAAPEAHTWSAWETVSEATVFAAETQRRVCVSCGAEETRLSGTALTPTISANAASLPLKKGQATSAFRISGMAKGDYVKKVTSNRPGLVKVKSFGADGSVRLKAQKKTGKAKLTITLASGLTKTVTVKVRSAAVRTKKITLPVRKLTLKKGEKISLQPLLAPITSQEAVSYTSSDKKTASVSRRGVVAARKTGTARITVRSGSKKTTATVIVR